MKAPPEFSPELERRVKDAIERSDYCMFGRDEMERLWATSKCLAPNHLKLLQKFAESCGVEVETGITLRWARFVARKMNNARSHHGPMEEMMRRMA